MGKSFWIILGVVLVAGVGLLFFAGSDSGTTNDGTGNDVLTVQEDDHKRGLAGSAVAVIEYGDFQCPACGALAPVVNQMFVEFGDQVEFVFRHFPLISIHPNAMSSSRAAEAAGQQDAFWEMHDLLFENQQSWSSSTSAASIFQGYAGELGLDIDKYNGDVNSEDASNAINADLQGGQSVGVNATPSYFVAGVAIPTPQSVEEFSAIIQAALDAANSTETTTETEPATDTNN